MPATKAKTVKASKTSPSQKLEVTPNVQTELHFTPPADAVVEVTHQGYIHWRYDNTQPKLAKTDWVNYRETIGQHEQLVVITDNGKAYPLPIADLPLAGEPKTILSLLPKGAQRDAKKVVAQFFLPAKPDRLELLLLTVQGRAKRLSGEELQELTNRGLMLLKLKESDRLGYVCLTQEREQVAIATNGGRVLRLAVTDEQLPVMGRSAQGNQAVKLRYQEQIVACLNPKPKQHLLLVSQLGYGKCLPVKALRIAKLGDMGNHVFQFPRPEDNLAGMLLADIETISLHTSSQRHFSIPLKKFPLSGKDGAGDRLVRLKSGEKAIAISSFRE